MLRIPESREVRKAAKPRRTRQPAQVGRTKLFHDLPAHARRMHRGRISLIRVALVLRKGEALNHSYGIDERLQDGGEARTTALRLRLPLSTRAAASLFLPIEMEAKAELYRLATNICVLHIADGFVLKRGFFWSRHQLHSHWCAKKQDVSHLTLVLWPL